MPGSTIKHFSDYGLLEEPVEWTVTSTRPMKNIPETISEKILKNLCKKRKEAGMGKCTMENVKGNPEKILQHLTETKFLDKKKTKEYGVKGTHYYLTIPEISGVKGFERPKQLDWFVSEKKFTEKELIKHPEWTSNLSSIEYILNNILGNMRDFFAVLGISMDEGMDFVKTFLGLDSSKSKSEIGCFMDERMGLDDCYRCNLSSNMRAIFGTVLHGGFCRPSKGEHNYIAHLWLEFHAR